MGLLSNIYPFLQLTATGIRVLPHLKKINTYRAAGDNKAEWQEIADTQAEWIDDVITTFDLHFHVQGREHLSKDSCVYIANHQSYFDIMAVTRVVQGYQVGFIAKEEFKKIPLLSPWITGVRGIFLARGDAREALKSLKVGGQYLKEGFSLCIFPEGTRMKTPGLGEFKAGSFKLATKAKVPVVPIAIEGTRAIFEEQNRLIRGAEAKVTVLPPIPTADMSRTEQAELPEKVRSLINDIIN